MKFLCPVSNAIQKVDTILTLFIHILYKGIRYVQRLDYEIIDLLSDKYSVVDLCDIMDINRSGYYKWIKNNCYPIQFLSKNLFSSCSECLILNTFTTFKLSSII